MVLLDLVFRRRQLFAAGVVALCTLQQAGIVHGFLGIQQRQRAAHRVQTPSQYETATAFRTSTATALNVVPPPLATQAAAAAAGSSAMENPLLTYFLQTVIANGVPAVFAILVIGFTAFQFRPKKNNEEDLRRSSLSTNPLSQLYDDLYGDQEQGKQKPMFRGFGPPKLKELPKNTGVPKLKYLDVTHLNQKYDSYRYSLTAATEGKAVAAAQYRASAFERAFGKALPASTCQVLQTIEQDFLKKAKEFEADKQKLTTAIMQQTIDQEMKHLGLESVYQLDPAVNGTNATTTTNSKSTMSMSMGNSGLDFQTRLFTVQKELQQLELDFVQKVVAAVGPEHATAVRTAILGSNGERPLSALLTSATTTDEQTKKGKVYITNFPGDPSASQVAELRQVVTAIVQNASPDDEVIVKLQTGGGTVTGYGLAAAQLMRIKEAGMKLTIAVEQVAASGGYMMACIADKIVASPFAVLGSIGVISDIPNVYERLKEEGIEFQTVTAGKYKRTLTPTKKVTREDFQKSKEDVEEILVLFRDFVAQNRPQLDIDKVATGETWFGTAALEKNLCDEIKTVDEVLTDYIDDGYDVYEIAYKPPPAETPLGKLLPVGATGSTAVQWLVGTVADAVKNELNLNIEKPVQERYMVKDDTSEKIRAQD